MKFLMASSIALTLHIGFVFLTYMIILECDKNSIIILVFKQEI